MHVHVVVIGPFVRQAVDEGGVPMVGKDDRLVGRENGVELSVR